MTRTASRMRGRFESLGRSSGVIDATLFALLIGALSTLPIGFLSGDAVAHSAAFDRGTWFWNPNHLLVEPISAWWQGATLAAGIDRVGVDRLKMLSILSGAVAAGLFRAGPATLLAPGRAAANLATAWFVGLSAFLRLLISGETHMLQMPALVVAAWCLILLVQDVPDPRSRWRWLTGGAIGVAGLFYISNLLLAFTVPLALLASGREGDRRWSRAWPVPVAAGVVAGLGLTVAWLALRPEAGLPGWILSYAGGQVPQAVADSYGTRLTLPGIAAAAARTAYGAASAVVDVSPLVQVARGVDPASAVDLLRGLAAVGAGLFLVWAFLRLALRRGAGQHRAALVVVGSFTAAVLLFGLYWNNSDDQFFFQLAVAAGALTAVAPPWRWAAPRLATAFAVGVLLWNVADTAERFVLYPRTERIAMLREELAGADLVVLPGEDEPDRLLYFMPELKPEAKLSLTSLKARHPPDEGLAVLRGRIAQVLEAGGRVELLGLYDEELEPQPWRSLEAAGYTARRVRAAVEVGPSSEPRTRGPFSFVTLVPPDRQ